MNAAVFAQIADYFKLIHEKVVWPVAGPPDTKKQPQKPATCIAADKLAEFHHALLRSYVRAVRVFEPAQPCSSNDDCLNQGEICVKGECRPGPGSGQTALSVMLQRCSSNDDCLNQGELCIGGFCVPNPYALVVAPVGPFAADAAYYDELQSAFHAYYARIQDVLISGLAKDPSKTVEVRDVLMRMFADCAGAAGARRCSSTDDCANCNETCVDGFCVPYPFRLVFRAPGRPMTAPWVL